MKADSEVLRDAASLIDAYGWCQGTFETDDGCICASEAIARADGDRRSPMLVPAWRAFADYVNWPLVSLWNDRPGMTADRVVATFRRCADDLERSGR